MLCDILEENDTLRVLNVETNYLSGEFFAKLLRAALKFQSLEELKAVNQVRVKKCQESSLIWDHPILGGLIFYNFGTWDYRRGVPEPWHNENQY